MAGLVTSSSPLPLKTHRVGQRCTLNLSRAETSSRWYGVVVRREGASSGVVPRHLTMVQNYAVPGIYYCERKLLSDIEVSKSRECVEDGERSGRPQTSLTAENIEKLSAAVCKNRLQPMMGPTALPHYPPSPDFVPFYYRIFPELAFHLWGHRFQFADEIKSASQAELKDTAKNRFQKSFNDLYKRWQKCVVAQRSYLKEGCVSVI
ncbi:hypothetical protein TNCV_1955891 [Trichonephila clavipes]|nr:hypothetical protein TNCV_1955891 [Trichonephila clavipes]